MSSNNPQDKRVVFFQELIKLAEIDSSIILLTNDVGYSFVDKFSE